MIGRAFLKLRQRDLAITILRNKRGDGFLVPPSGESDDPLHIIFNQERQQINAASRHRAIRGEGDHRPPGGARDAARFLDASREDGSQNDLRALVHGGLSRRRRASRRGMVVLDQNTDVVRAGIRIGELRRVAERRPNERRPGSLGERDDQRDFHRTVADLLARLARRRESRTPGVVPGAASMRSRLPERPAGLQAASKAAARSSTTRRDSGARAGDDRFASCMKLPPPVALTFRFDKVRLINLKSTDLQIG